ncbi:Uncharacterised protein [uncultured archaeon]|nr:Uncharacterised protein [uncultured archaeon]
MIDVDKPTKVLVCPVCGSMDIVFVTVVQGSVLPYYQCNNCGSRMMPIVFDSVEQAREYAKAKKQE